MKIIQSAIGAIVLGIFGQAHAGGYAEELYKDFSEQSNGALTFSVNTVDEGELNQLQDVRVARLIGFPSYRVSAEDTATSIAKVDLHDSVTLDKAQRTDLLGDNVQAFEDEGLPLSEGRYRVLSVTVSTGKRTLEHLALEACWEARGHCFVVDYHVEFVDSIVNGIREQKARGYAMKSVSEPAASLAKAGTCGLASNRSLKSRQFHLPAYSREKKRFTGRVLYRVNVGELKVGVRCDSSCTAQPWGFVNGSTGNSTGIFSTACSDALQFAREGRTVRQVGKTGCAHKATLNAKFDLSVEGRGTLGLEINHAATGSVEMNAKHYQDSCALF